MKRPRLTPSNIRNQAATAPPGTIVHSVGALTCPRKLNKTDVTYDGNVTKSGEAYHIENVTCLHCRKEYYRRQNEYRRG